MKVRLVHICMSVAMIMTLFCQTINADFTYDIGVTINAGYDDNMALDDDRYVDDDSIYVIQLNPTAELHWFTARQVYRTQIRYLHEFYVDNSDDLLENSDSFLMNSTWTYRILDSLDFVFADGLDLAGFGTDYNDHPVSRQDYLEYESFSGLRWKGIDNLTLTLDIIWGMMEFETFQSSDILSLHGKDWDDLGFRFQGEYSAIPEMVFLVEYSWKSRAFSENPEMPELSVAQGYFGFRTKLQTDTEITLKGSLYHVEYDGIPPRRTETNYNNYGAQLTVHQKVGTEIQLDLDAYTKYELSHRMVRMFYRNSGIHLKGTWDLDQTTQVNGWLKYDKLKYFGRQPEEELTVFNTGISLTHQINEIVSISGTYRYYDRDNDWSLIRSSNRIFATISFRMPEF